jgi:hypothetical protein
VWLLFVWQLLQLLSRALLIFFLLWKLINGLFIYYAEPHFPPFSIKLFAPRVIKFLYPKRDFFDPQSHQHHTPKEDINARKRKGEKSPGKIIK